MKFFATKIGLCMACDKFFLLYPFYTLIMIDHGLTPIEVSLCITGWMVAMILFTFPTGVLADRYSRRHMITISQIFYMAGYISFISIYEFWAFLLGMTLWGIGYAFGSGTYESLLFDGFKRLGRKDEFTKTWGIIGGISNGFAALACVAGALLVDYGWEIYRDIGIASCLIAIVTMLTIPRVRPLQSIHRARALSATRRTFDVLMCNKRRLWIFVLYMGFLGIIFGMEDYWPVYFEETGLSLDNIGYAVAGIMLAYALGGFIAQFFEHMTVRMFAVITFFNSLLFLAGMYTTNIWGIVFLLTFITIYSMLKTNFTGVFHSIIESETRSTVASVVALMIEVVCIFMVLGVGYATEALNGNYLHTLQYLSIIFTIGCLIFAIILPAKRYTISYVRKLGISQFNR